ncbi:MAG: DnaJ C-terminal domain-containing protein [Parvibaculum sp.]
MRSPYEVLGVDPGVDATEIKAAYRRLAKQLHPDAHKGNPITDARFQEVTAAYNLLKDAEGRRRYDAERRAAQMSARAAAFDKAGAGFRTDATPPQGRDDIFSDLFGGIRNAGQRVFRARGDDVAYKLSIPFLDAVRGGKARLQLQNGKSIDVSVPEATEDGQMIRLRGLGGEGFGGGEAGDALVTLQIEPHPYFKRRGADIEINLPVTLAEAVLGAKVEVPTIHGPVSLTIPPGSNSGFRMRLKERGLTRPQGKGKGDQYVTLVITLPDKTDSALADFAASWVAGLKDNPRKGFSGA